MSLRNALGKMRIISIYIRLDKDKDYFCQCTIYYASSVTFTFDISSFCCLIQNLSCNIPRPKTKNQEEEKGENNKLKFQNRTNEY